MWYLIALIPDFSLLSYFRNVTAANTQTVFNESDLLYYFTADTNVAAAKDDDDHQRKLMGIVLGSVGAVLLVCLIVFGYLNWVHRRYEYVEICVDSVDI